MLIRHLSAERYLSPTTEIHRAPVAPREPEPRRLDRKSYVVNQIATSTADIDFAGIANGNRRCRLSVARQLLG